MISVIIINPVKVSAASPTDAQISNTSRVLTEGCLATILGQVETRVGPSWYNDYYYSINVYATTQIVIRTFPKNATTRMILGRNSQDSDLYDIDNWYLFYNDTLTVHRIIFTSACAYSSYATHTTLDTIITNDVYYTNLPAFTYLSYITGVAAHNTTLTSVIAADYGSKEIPSSILVNRGYIPQTDQTQTDQLKDKLTESDNILISMFQSTVGFLSATWDMFTKSPTELKAEIETKLENGELNAITGLFFGSLEFFKFIIDLCISVINFIIFILNRFIEFVQILTSQLITGLFGGTGTLLSKMTTFIDSLPTQIQPLFDGVYTLVFSLFSIKVISFLVDVTKIVRLRG